MSLDVSLRLPGTTEVESQSERIFVRRDGETAEVTRAEWEDLYPGRDPVTVLVDDNYREVYEANITHNLGRMAGEVDLYEPLWRPDEIGVTRAAQLVEPLKTGLRRLRDEKERLQAFNPSNGWGDYDLLVRFTEGYLLACLRWPNAEVEVSR